MRVTCVVCCSSVWLYSNNICLTFYGIILKWMSSEKLIAYENGKLEKTLWHPLIQCQRWKLINSAAVMVDKMSTLTLFKKTCFSAFSTFKTSAGKYLRPERPLVSLKFPKDSCCSSGTVVPNWHKKSPLKVWLSHRNSSLNGVSVMDSC